MPADRVAFAVAEPHLRLGQLNGLGLRFGKTSEMPDLLKTKWESRLTCRGNEETFKILGLYPLVLRGGEMVDGIRIF